MIKVIKLNLKDLQLIKKEFIEIYSRNLSSKEKNLDKIIKKLIQKTKLREGVYHASNMMTSLGYYSFKVCKILEKTLGKKLLNWSYPQVRIDDEYSASKFSTPAHEDGWFIDKNKKGYIFWFPINEKGASLYVQEKTNRQKSNHKLVKHTYWGKQIVGSVKFKKFNVKYGQALLFSQDVIHKSDEDNSRITVQFRFEELNKIKLFRRSVVQVFTKKP
jgi:hypothetical protein